MEGYLGGSLQLRLDQNTEMVVVQATYRFWLFNDCIVFATESLSSAGQALRFLSVSSGSTKLKFAGRFSLQGLRIEDLEDTASLYNAFNIVPSSSSPASSLVPTIPPSRDEPRYTLILPTFADKKDWLTELQNAIDRISKYKGKLAFKPYLEHCVPLTGYRLWYKCLVCRSTSS